MTKTGFIAEYWEAIKAACAGTGVMPEVALAAGAVESAWGESGLTKAALNFFGIKSTESWEAEGGKYVELLTWEMIKGKRVQVMAKFRKYATVEDCFRNYAHFVTQPGYVALGVLEAKTPEAQIKAIAGKYATDPDYAAKLIGTMHGLMKLGLFY
jgi:flagellar protein FlgJ